MTLDEVVARTGLGKSTCRRHIATLMTQGRLAERTLEPTAVGRPPIIYYDPKKR
jgi:predicted ArsR family transcriptional regulator